MKEVIIHPPPDFKSGSYLIQLKKDWNDLRNDTSVSMKTLDLSNVFFMDSDTFRLVFDHMSIFNRIIPPKSQWVTDMFDQWLDGKKGLSK